MYIDMFICMCVYVCIYIYTYIERERYTHTFYVVLIFVYTFIIITDALGNNPAHTLYFGSAPRNPHKRCAARKKAGGSLQQKKEQ